MLYCGKKKTAGHGSNSICGELFYGTIWQCDVCKARNSLSDLETLLLAYDTLIIRRSSDKSSEFFAVEVDNMTFNATNLADALRLAAQA